MAITKAHRDYEKKIYDDLGIDKNFFLVFVKPTIRKIKGKNCENCGSDKDTQIHHSDMQVVNIYTLKLLCRSCHEKVHHKKMKIR